MNLPRQGKPTTIIIEGGEELDRESILERVRGRITNNGDDTLITRNATSISIRHYPRAVND